MYQILIVDSEERHIKSIQKILGVVPKEYSFLYASTPEIALDILNKQKIDVIICELEFPIMSGEELFCFARQISPGTIPIALSPAEDISSTLEAINRSRASKLILKPCKVAGDILIPIEEAIRMEELRKEGVQEKKERQQESEQTYQSHKKIKNEVAQKKAEYGIIMDMMMRFVDNNLSSKKGDLTEKVLAELQGYIKESYENFIKYYIFGTRDWGLIERELLEKFHNPQVKSFLKIDNRVEEGIPKKLTPSMAYALHTLLELVHTQFLMYQVSVTLAKKEKNMILLFRCNLDGSKDENGKVQYRIMDRENFEKIYRVTVHMLRWVSHQVVVKREKNPYAMNLSFEI